MLARLKAIPYLPLLAGLMVLRMVVAGVTDLVPDEAYYWLWAQHPAFGYYDHPPMVAWWIGAGTAVFGDTPFGVRITFALSFVALSWLMWDAARVLFGEAVAKRTLLWLNACLLLGAGSVIATPDPPSVLMWAAALWALSRLSASQKGIWWLAFGLFAGLGVEAKYTNLFLGLGVLVWFAVDKPARRWLLTPWPWFGAVIAVVMMLPNLLWNMGHGWITVAKQFGRIGADHLTLRYLIELIITQPLLLNLLIFVFAAAGLKAAFRTADSRLRLLAALPLPLIVYLFVHVFHDRIQGNWPAPVYPGLILLAAAAAETTTRTRLKTWAAPFGIALSVLGLVFLGLSAAVPMPGPAGLSQGWNRFAATLKAQQAGTGAAFIATTDYDTEGELSFHMPGTTVAGLTERARYAWSEGDVAGRMALIVVRDKDAVDPAQCFDSLTSLGAVSRGKGKAARYRLYSGILRATGCDLSVTP